MNPAMNEVVNAIKKGKRYLISAHVNLEGDSLGSQLAARELLKGLGKEVEIVDADPVPEQYKFLPNTNEVSDKASGNLKFDVALILDCPTLKRIGKVSGLISKDMVVINVDHHISNENFGHINWVDPNASSAGEMVYKLFKETGVVITREAALYLYIAILTDTGSFNYDNTSRLTHEIAGELLGYGLDPASVSESIYEHKSISDIKFLGMVLSTLKVNKDGDIAYLEITKKMVKDAGVDMSKSENFVNYARSIDEIKVAIIFKEESADTGRINVSFRSRGDADVNRIAAYFGGGGHARASGCIVEASLDDAKRKVLAQVEEVLHGKR